MSKLDELIKELCPNGVKYKELGEIFNLKNGYTPSKSNSEYWENGDVNWFRIEDINTNGGILENSIQRVNIKGIKGNLFAAKSLIVSTTATIGKHALILKEFICNQQFTCLTIKENYEKIYNSKFMYYYFFKISELVKKNLKVSSFPSVDMDKFKKFLIPLPPLEVQEEIVRILDNYTKSVEELKEKLNKELIARKKQYSWYRDYLLKFENKVKIVKLKDIATEIYRGNGIKREEVRETGIPCVRYGEIYTEYGIAFEKTKSYTDENLITNKKYIDYGDILFAITGESVEEIGKSTAYIGKEKCLVGGDILVMKHKQDPVYLSYVLSTENSQKQKSKGKIKSKVVHTNATDIGEIEIPLPPLEVQKRIVEVLDNFEKICNDLNIGLPAEIEARQKQYEFYRNFLLTFNNEEIYALSKQASKQAQNLIKILQYVYGYVELELDKVANITMGVSPNGNSIIDIKNEKNIEFHQGKTYFGETMLLQSNVYTNEPKKYAENNSIVMSVRAPVGDTNMVDRKISIGRGLCSILADKEISITKYLYYYIKSNVNKLKAMSNGSTFEAINSESIRKFTVSLPPLEEQQRIVDILDRFDKLCNDISEGLPAEIEARQKQYEYYREKLLNFKKL